MTAQEFMKRRARIGGTWDRAQDWQQNAMKRLIREARAVPVIGSRRVVAYRLGAGEVVCVKQRFKDEPAATQSLQMIHEERQPREHIPVRAYQCTHCKGWHITSMKK